MSDAEKVFTAAEVAKILADHEARIQLLEASRQPRLHEKIWDQLPTAESVRLAEAEAKKEIATLPPKLIQAT
jgi:hypothetical protein